jgi:histidinol-phosphatase (PHP family)
LTRDDFDLYFSEGRRLRDKYRQQLFVGLGVEVGYNPERREELLAALAERDWDRVAISYHFMRVGDQHYNLLSRKEYNISALGKLGVDGVLSAYFDTLLEAVETVPAEVVCHLDAAMRYHPDVRLLESHRQQMRNILVAMAERGMALEVNSSGCRMRGEPFPGQDMIREAEGLNIPLVAGSDAHRPADVGSFEMLGRIFS